MTIEWTEEVIQQLIDLCGEGLSNSAVARRMRTTKNSVVGKLNRLRREGVEIPERVAPASLARANEGRRRPDQPERPKRVRAGPSAPPLGQGEPAPRAAPRRVGEVEPVHFSRRTCLFPEETEGRMRLCEAPTEGHKSYCPTHQKIVYAERQPTLSVEKALAPRRHRDLNWDQL